jgi:hypothetical protein
MEAVISIKKSPIRRKSVCSAAGMAATRRPLSPTVLGEL